MLEWIYWSISWILLRWHQMWDAILPDRAFLATNWDWILAIVFLVITVRVILFPIFVKQIRSQRAMQAIQPKMKELQEKHKGDRETLQKEMMELYRKEKVNPLMGCLPIFLQIPVFLGLFHVLRRISTTNSQPELYGWTKNEFLSAAVARLFDAPITNSFATGDTIVKIVAGILVIIMMVTTFLTSRQMILKTGWSVDPQQRMIQKLMLYGIPFSLLLSGWYFPIGVIIYWVTQNLFSLGQQFWVLHKYPPPVMPGATPAKALGGRGGETKAAGDKGRAIAAGGAKGIVQQEKSGLFRRKRDSAPAAPVTPRLDGKALAPKPGAKPVTAKKTMSSKKKGGAKR
jgi:YidC/Oxa1 family membrane protein insertase